MDITLCSEREMELCNFVRIYEHLDKDLFKNLINKIEMEITNSNKCYFKMNFSPLFQSYLKAARLYFSLKGYSCAVTHDCKYGITGEASFIINGFKENVQGKERFIF